MTDLIGYGNYVEISEIIFVLRTVPQIVAHAVFVRPYLQLMGKHKRKATVDKRFWVNGSAR